MQCSILHIHIILIYRKWRIHEQEQRVNHCQEQQHSPLHGTCRACASKGCWKVSMSWCTGSSWHSVQTLWKCWSLSITHLSVRYHVGQCTCACSAVSDSSWRHGPIRLLCPWNFPGKNTGVGCHFLLQGIFPIQGSKWHYLHLFWKIVQTQLPMRKRDSLVLNKENHWDIPS